MKKYRFGKSVSALCFFLIFMIISSCVETSGYVSLTEIEIEFIPKYMFPQHDKYSSISVIAKCNRKHFYMYENYLSEKVTGIEVLNTITGERLDSMLMWYEFPIPMWIDCGIQPWFTRPLPPGRYKFQLSLVLDDGRRLTDETDEIEITAVPEE